MCRILCLDLQVQVSEHMLMSTCRCMCLHMQVHMDMGVCECRCVHMHMRFNNPAVDCTRGKTGVHMLEVGIIDSEYWIIESKCGLLNIIGHLCTYSE